MFSLYKKISSLLNNLLTSGIAYEDNNPFKHKYFVIKFINVISLIAILATAAFLVSFLLPGRDNLHGSLVISISITFIMVAVVTILLRVTRNVDLAANLLIITLFFVNTGHTFYTNNLGGDTDDIILVLLVAPLFMFILKGALRGILWSIMFFIFFLFIMTIRPALYYELEERMLDIFLMIIPALSCMALYIYVNEKYAEKAEKNQVELEKAISAQSELVKSKEIFVNIAAHKLRTPVSIMRGIVEKMKKEMEGNPQVNESFSILENTTERMHLLVNSILEIFELDKMNVKGRLQEVDIQKLLEAVVNNQKLNAESKSVLVELHLPEDQNTKIVTDAIHIKESLINIVSNAIDYNQSGGRVDISLIIEKDACIIKISDTGMGISKNSHESIFEKFYRSEAAVLKKPDGAGLGLYIAKAYIELYGGSISFKSPVSSENKGTEFIVKLPVKR